MSTLEEKLEQASPSQGDSQPRCRWDALKKAGYHVERAGAGRLPELVSVALAPRRQFWRLESGDTYVLAWKELMEGYSC